MSVLHFNFDAKPICLLYCYLYFGNSVWLEFSKRLINALSFEYISIRDYMKDLVSSKRLFYYIWLFWILIYNYFILKISNHLYCWNILKVSMLVAFFTRSSIEFIQRISYSLRNVNYHMTDVTWMIKNRFN